MNLVQRFYKEYLFASHYNTKTDRIERSSEGVNEERASTSEALDIDIIQWAEFRAGDKARANANSSRSHEAAFNLLLSMIQIDPDELTKLINEIKTLPIQENIPSTWGVKPNLSSNRYQKFLGL